MPRLLIKSHNKALDLLDILIVYDADDGIFVHLLVIFPLGLHIFLGNWRSVS